MAVLAHDQNELLRLLAGGADVRTKAYFHRTVLEPIDCLWHSPASDSTVDDAIACMDILLKHGASLHTRSGTITELIYQQAPAALLEAMIATVPRASSEMLDAPLFEALSKYRDGKRDVIRMLLEAGANPNKEFKHSGGTNIFLAFIMPSLPLHVAVCDCSLDVIKLLLDFGADPFARAPHDGMTALGWARHCNAHSPPSLRVKARYKEILCFFEDLETCRRTNSAIWPALEKELMEVVWHPHRLQRLGYFDLDDES